MKYGDLIQFEPIESVVQLRDADEATAARQTCRDLRYIRGDGGKADGLWFFPSCNSSTPRTIRGFWWWATTARVNPISCR